MSDEELLLAAVALGVGLYIYSDIKSAFKGSPQTQAQTTHMFQQAGGDVYSTSTGTFWAIPGGSARIDNGWTPNLAQKILVGLDTFVPGDWLTRQVFGV